MVLKQNFDYLFDNKISLEAKGLLGMILAIIEETEEFSLEIIRENIKEDSIIISSAFQELIDNGYLKIT